MQSSIRSVKHSRNPIKFSIADAIKMYLKKPITSLQLTSLQRKEKKELMFELLKKRNRTLNALLSVEINIEWSDHKTVVWHENYAIQIATYR